MLFLLLVQHSALRHGSILALGALFRVGGQKQSFSERRLHEQSGFLTVPLTQLLPLPLNLTLILTLTLTIDPNSNHIYPQGISTIVSRSQTLR